MKSHFSTKQGALVSHSWLGWVASSNHQLRSYQTRSNCIFCPIVIQLAWLFIFLHASHVCFILASHHLQVSCESSHKSPSCCTLLIKYSLSQTKPLHYSHLKTGFLNAELQANLAWNKANTWLNKFNLTLTFLLDIHSLKDSNAKFNVLIKVPIYKQGEFMYNKSKRSNSQSLLHLKNESNSLYHYLSTCKNMFTNSSWLWLFFNLFSNSIHVLFPLWG